MMSGLKKAILSSYVLLRQERTLRSFEQRADEVVITRRAARPGDARPGRESPITYELSLPSGGGALLTWNPDSAMEPLQALTRPGGNKPITEKLLREVILRDAVAESREGTKSRATSAFIEDGKVLLRYQPR